MKNICTQAGGMDAAVSMQKPLAFGGVFAKRKLLCILTAWTLLVCTCGLGGGLEDWQSKAMGDTLAAQLDWLKANAVSGGDYTLRVYADESIGPHSLYFSGRSIGITLRGGARGLQQPQQRTISLNNNGSLFTVNSGVSLILDSNITLQGRSNNNSPLVLVEGGRLVMNAGSAITGNTNTSASSGYVSGVYVVGYGTFTMNGGTISGGVSGIHTMNGGTISGGVSGILTMNGGTISRVSMSTSSRDVSATFTMNGGTISGSSYSGVDMNGYNGSVTFTMNGGTISGNTNRNSGGGVCVFGGRATFTMSGGTISGNTAASGGGVYVFDGGTFTKTGGTIYGYSASDTVNSNVVKDSSGTVQSNRGHAVYISDGNGNLRMRRETTAGPSVNLDSRVYGTAGGWEN